MDTNNLTKPHMLMLLGGNLLTIIGCFMPFVSVFGFGVNYIEGDGKLVLILCIVSIALAFFKANVALFANIIALVITLVGILKAAAFSLDLLGMGAYFILIGSIVAIVGSVKSKNA